MIKLKNLVTVMLLTLIPVSISATAQLGEFLDYNGNRVTIFSTPLESYFSKENPRPEFPMMSTANWRGYIGVWKIENQKLYLVSLHEEDLDSDDLLGKQFDLSKIFPKKKPPISAEWYSGLLRIPEGEQLKYVHMGFSSIFEQEIYLTVSNGKIIKSTLIDNTGKDAFRSRYDIQWVLKADKPARDGGKWFDARVLPGKSFSETRKSGTSFVTRGIYSTGNENEPAQLWIPESLKTPETFIPIESLPVNASIDHGSHIEIHAHYVKTAHQFKLLVDRIRALKPGETIHHPEFKATDPSPTSGI